LTLPLPLLIAFIGLSTFIALCAQQRLSGGTATGTAALFVLYFGGVVGSVLGSPWRTDGTESASPAWNYLVPAVAMAALYGSLGRAST
jgi:FSR family fosmidomycin resistance protein-like MFS transporter